MNRIADHLERVRQSAREVEQQSHRTASVFAAVICLLAGMTGVLLLWFTVALIVILYSL